MAEAVNGNRNGSSASLRQNWVIVAFVIGVIFTAGMLLQRVAQLEVQAAEQKVCIEDVKREQSDLRIKILEKLTKIETEIAVIKKGMEE